MTSAVVSHEELAALVARLAAAGTTVVAPVAVPGAAQAEYRPISRLDDAALAGPLPRNSLKELFLPPSEVLLRYRVRKDGVALDEVPTSFKPRVVLGARPCDAAGVELLDRVMAWGCRDELWFGRRDATTIVTVACPGADSTCFCTAVGIGPDATRGADAILMPLGCVPADPSSPVARQMRDMVDGFLSHDQRALEGDGEAGGSAARAPGGGAHLARALTAKGEALLAGVGRAVATSAELALAEEYARAARARIDRNVEAFGLAPEGRPDMTDWLARNFDHPLWKTLALRCHGCGACAAVCSTCHCFDIVDEHDGCAEGARRRNWDSCQSAKFTAHASGHNPRKTQAERFRQRVMHKFSIYPRRFDALLCTGCGRCARACGAGTSLPEILGRFAALARGEAAGRSA